MPANPDAERAVLSCMLLDPVRVIARAVETLSPAYFYTPAHRIIFEAMMNLYRTRPGGDLDLVVLNTELIDRGQMEAVGGPGYLAALIDDVPTVALFDDYVGFLKEKFILRRIIRDCTDCVSGAYDVPASAAEFLDGVEKRVFAIRDEAEGSTRVIEMRERMLSAIETIEAICQGNTGSGLATGYKDLDAMTNGLRGGEMIVIAARPAMGKTSFVMNIVENVATRKSDPIACAVFSLEMTAESLSHRLLCSRARVSMQKLRGGFLSKVDFARIAQAAAELSEAKVLIDDTPGLSIHELQAKARRFKQQYDIGLIAIDYLQLLKAPEVSGRDGREKEIAAISGGIKGIAKELNIPVIVLAQLNRNPDARGGKPRMSDLRESGSIEQDADLVGLIVRPEVYADADEIENLKGEAELVIAKHRNGPTGEVPLTFLKDLMRFETRAREVAA